MTIRKLTEVENLEGKKVLVRADFNVPLRADGTLADQTRIRETLPTIQWLLEMGASVTVISHLGRPKGKVVERYRLAPVGGHLAKDLASPVLLLPETIGPMAERARKMAPPGIVTLLENLRFYPEETNDDDKFARELSKNTDLFVNDAFGACHRAHASIVGIPRHVPSVIGLLIEKELAHLQPLMEDPKRPYMVILGGAKVSDKLGVLYNLMDKADVLLIGGAMAFTFLKAEGHNVGTSLVEAGALEEAKNLMKQIRERGKQLLLPVDFVGAPNFESQEVDIWPLDRFPYDHAGFDIGPKTTALYERTLSRAHTVFWNGPMGVFEREEYSRGTFGVAKALNRVAGVTIVGGGDSAAALQAMENPPKISHISTGGGASLEFLEGKILPGLKAIADCTLPLP